MLQLKGGEMPPEGTTFKVDETDWNESLFDILIHRSILRKVTFLKENSTTLLRFKSTSFQQL